MFLFLVINNIIHVFGWQRSEAATSTIGRSVHIESAGSEQVSTPDLDITVHPISNREQIDIGLSNESSSPAVTLETVIKRVAHGLFYLNRSCY